MEELNTEAAALILPHKTCAWSVPQASKRASSRSVQDPDEAAGGAFSERQPWALGHCRGVWRPASGSWW